MRLRDFRPALLFVVSLGVLTSCDRSEREDKLPLASAMSGSGASGAEDALSPRAQTALAAGNEAYRAAMYDEALAEYTIAVKEAPTSAAPYYGVLMVAQKTGNTLLADSASAMIRKLSGEDAAVHDAIAVPLKTPHGAP